MEKDYLDAARQFYEKQEPNLGMEEMAKVSKDSLCDFLTMLEMYKITSDKETANHLMSDCFIGLLIERTSNFDEALNLVEYIKQGIVQMENILNKELKNEM